MGPIKVFCGNANRGMAKNVATHLNLELGDTEVGKFSDGETKVVVNETVRGADVFIVQSTSPPANDNLMELLIMIDAMRRSSAGRITAVIPYYGYARQDRRARSHDPISAKLVADMITSAGANRILTMDLHCPQIQGFFNIPLDHLKGVYLFADYFQSKAGLGDSLEDVVVVSPDLGSVARCQGFADILEVPLAIVDKRRHNDKKVEMAHFIGNVKGKYAILLDDVLATGGSLCNAARTVMEHGAKAVFACVTHPILCGDAVENIVKSPIEEIVTLDTIELSPEKRADKIKVLSVAKYVGEAINCIHNNQSIGELFRTMGG
ncbi:MAG: ribose-phosphate pyrophosphokinase [Defluviitaleaceae bacterium]|nr:ribose-phosphate pyrophosphokinase [Defluviitaleaceae bacterium]MCL2262638.1 ribose-phosphate pyrophosphokinase [Defluviitaleaceae bacterium]